MKKWIHAGVNEDERGEGIRRYKDINGEKRDTENLVRHRSSGDRRKHLPQQHKH